MYYFRSVENQSASYPKYTFNEALNQEQISYFNQTGFIQFRNFLSKDHVKNILDSLNELQEQWIRDDVKVINGVPIHYGFDDEGNKIVHRFAFTSLHCPIIHDLVKGPEIRELLKLLNRTDGRIGETEKDGVVVNQYINSEKSERKQMGWHTDSLRDIFYGQKILPMLNVGIYLSDSKLEQGGLKILPGTHKQSIYSMLFKKPYFVNNEPDKNEVSVIAEAGDLTVHHGHIWHRVAMAPFMGVVSRRIIMYIPLICGKQIPKSETSETPFYHRLKKFAKR
ncbi:MAG: phytanoyl-CoA dioxygenase family protein [Bacteroidia bacterium]